ncbi:protein takeout-like isoform X2 [Frankliniella occidentalis]|uniref:Protein takeout-like isoform X2 n=1 Tax=Frankliniella occidentalis TaxID=133901 RepID=A0A6J1S451_FRAOC|nr:protein takeout-like isoform X2 [Frankliniella occidentalis]
MASRTHCGVLGTAGTAIVPLLSAAILVGVVSAAKLPADIKRCARTDPKFFSCLRDAVQDTLPKLKNGLPKLGLPPLDPLLVSELRISQGDGPVGLNLVFKDLVTTGLLDNDKVYNTEIDLENLTINATFLFPRAIATSNYTVNGRVLLLPVTGAGGSKVVLKDCTCKWHIQGKRIKKKDGKEYMDIQTTEIKMTPKKMELQLDNLFGGDPRLGTTMNRVLNDNWELVYNEIGSSFEIAYAEVVRQHARSLFLHVPLDELFPEKL